MACIAAAMQPWTLASLLPKGDPLPKGSSDLMASISELNSTVVALQATVRANKADADGTAATLATAMKETDTFYILFAGCLVFIMQCGFACLEAGSVRDKNVRNVLLTNALDASVGAIVWYLFGYGIATSGNAFIGTTAGNYALSGLDDTTSSYSSAGYDWCAALRRSPPSTSPPAAQTHPLASPRP